MSTICSNCGKENLAGAMVCSRCGYLFHADNKSTVSSSEKGELHEIIDGRLIRHAHEPYLTSKNIAVYIDGREKPLLVDIGNRITFGRSVTTSPLYPTLDLSDYGAYEKGVSRTHASLWLSEKGLFVEDHGSSNGTYYQGKQLTPHTPVMIKSGERVALGQLMLEFYFLPELLTNTTPESESSLSDKRDSKPTPLLPPALLPAITTQDSNPSTDTSGVETPASDQKSINGHLEFNLEQSDLKVRNAIHKFIDQLADLKDSKIKIAFQIKVECTEANELETRTALLSAIDCAVIEGNATLDSVEPASTANPS